MIDLHRAVRVAAGLGVMLILGACATTRGEMALSVPDAGTMATTGGDKVAVIESVQDRRQFQVDPRDPSIPSLKEGEQYALDAEGRKRAIARKRGGFGKAMGDILLEGGDTVETLTRELIVQGLGERGYRVLAAGEPAPADALRVRADIHEFWGWFTPGMWVVSMEGKMRVDITATGADGTKTFSIPAYGINRGQSGREANWRLAFDRTFADYLAKQRAAFASKAL